MRKLWAVVRREFIERVRTKAFVIGTVLGPILLGLLIMLPILLQRRQTTPTQVVVVDAASGQFGRRVEGTLQSARRGSLTQARRRYDVTRVGAENRLEEVRDSLIALTGLSDTLHAIDGLLIITDDALVSGKITYLGSNVGSLTDMAVLENSLQRVVQQERLERAGVDPGVVRHAVGRVELQTAKVTEGTLTGESGEASFALAYVMSILLYTSLLLYGIQVMSSTLEEKSNRIVEVLVSSLTPFQLLLGKVLGVGAAGLFQMGIWAGTATLLTTYRVAVAGLFGVPPEVVAQLPIPTMTPALLLVFLVFFLLGFFLYAAAYAAVGAVCNTLQEAQQANTPITMTIAAGMICMFALLNEPNGTLARVMSLIPFLSPFVVPVRYSIAAVALPELLLSVAVTALGMIATVWVAARIYRIGILMYGKRPTLKEVGRWVWAG